MKQFAGKRMDLNCDVGEIDIETDEAILPFVSSCSVCCGAHAGDDLLIEATIRRAAELNIALGAHPSWPDRPNFGRKSLDIPLSDFEQSLREQIQFVKTLAENYGAQLQHVKPHGALYHDVLVDLELAEMFLRVVKEFGQNVCIYGQADSSFSKTCHDQGVRFVHEAFGDRNYESGNSLRSRLHANALIEREDDFLAHMKRLLSGSVVDVYGKEHAVTVQTICIHGDGPKATHYARIAHELITQQFGS
ncbi:MAG: LamB/YcsF family protein [Planctomycetota bacterium]